MADSYDGRDGSQRNTYRIALGHTLHPDNSGGMQWGTSYRQFHHAAWAEAIRVLIPGGIFILNIKDHFRDSKIMRVTNWHIATLRKLGLELDITLKLYAPGLRFGSNHEARVDYESVIRFYK
jgi:hypothetical protein